MRFAFVLFKFFPYGGMQRNMLAIARACAARGHEVHILASTWHGEQPGDVTVHILRVAGWTNAGRMQRFAQRFQIRLQRLQCDLVVGFNKLPGLDVYYAADSCFAAKAYEQRGAWYRATPRAKRYLEFERAVFGAEQHTCILEVSGKERGAFIRYYQTPAARFYTLPPGIDRNRIQPPDYQSVRRRTRDELRLADKEIALLAVGSGFKTKGLDRSIRLLAHMKAQANRAVRLFVVGADKAKRFENLAAELGVRDRVVFLGGRDDIPALLQAADLVLHPAVRENTGNILVEAMVAGRPVVATDVCGYAHYVHEANMGAVVPSPFRQQAYEQAVAETLAVNDGVWRERGAHFAARAELFSRPHYVSQLLETLVDTGARRAVETVA